MFKFGGEATPEGVSGSKEKVIKTAKKKIIEPTGLTDL